MQWQRLHCNYHLGFIIKHPDQQSVPDNRCSCLRYLSRIEDASATFRDWSWQEADSPSDFERESSCDACPSRDLQVRIPIYKHRMTGIWIVAIGCRLV
jgi:hypothetical protein